MSTLSIREFSKQAGQTPVGGAALSVRLMAKTLSEPSPISVRHFIQFLGGTLPGSLPSLATLSLQNAFVTRCTIIGVDGCLYVSSAESYDAWSAPQAVGTAFAPAGANIALAYIPYPNPVVPPVSPPVPPAPVVGAGVFTSVVIGNDGRLQTVWLDDSIEKSFQGPLPIGEPLFRPGGGVGLAELNGTFFAVAIGNDGRLYVASVVGTGSWKVPAPVGTPVAPAGGGIALFPQTSTSLAVVFIGIDGRLYVASITAGGVSAPVPVGSPFAPPGAHISLFPQNYTLVAALIGDNGCLWSAWLTAAGSWTSPVSTGAPIAPPGAHVALGRPSDEMLTCIFAGNDQRLWAASATAVGAWQPATPISSFPFANGGATVSLVPQFEVSLDPSLNRLAGVTLGNDGQLYLSIVTGTSTFTDPTPLPLTNYITSGTARPKYQVLTILYAPPGTNGGKGTATADYSNSSSTGTSNSLSSSFKNALNVSVSVGLGVGGSGGDGKSPITLGASASFSASRTTSETSSIQVTKNQTYDLKVYGPGADGINHDEDQMFIWLNPMVNIDIDGWGNIKWGLSVDGEEMVVQTVYIGQLKQPSTMPPDLLQQLTDAGLTQDDFNNIIDLNPFAYGNPFVDKSRFIPVGQSMPYDPPMNPGDMPVTKTYSRQDATVSAASSTVTTEYDVGVTVSAGLNLLFTATASVGAQFTWINTATSGTTSGSTHTSTLVIGGPALGYVSPSGKYPEVQPYWDTVYNTFVCAFLEDDSSTAR